jgi:hypothetical protein
MLFGLLVGGVFVAADVVESYPSGSTSGAASLMALLRVLAVLGLPLWAGLRAARSSGGVGGGVYAGLLTGGIGAVLWGVQLAVLPDFAPLAATQAVSLGSLQGSAFCSIPLFAGVGAVTGLIGGVIGAAQFKRAQQAARAEKAAQRERAPRDGPNRASG